MPLRNSYFEFQPGTALIMMILFPILFTFYDLLSTTNHLDKNKIGIINDINKLREKNIETVLMIADEIEDSFDEEKRHDAENCLKDVKLSEMIGKIIKNK